MGSVSGGETFAMADCFDAAYIFKHDLEDILGRRIPITILTHVESFIRIMVRSTKTTKKRLIIDIRPAR